jgi:hypothetical protein
MRCLEVLVSAELVIAEAPGEAGESICAWRLAFLGVVWGDTGNFSPSTSGMMIRRLPGGVAAACCRMRVDLRAGTLSYAAPWRGVGGV